MKHFKIIAILLLSSCISFYACNDNAKSSKQKTLEPTKVLDLPASPNAMTPNPAAAEPPQNAAGVWHYTCNKGCFGGAGTALNCATCGGNLTHNSGYHATANSTPSTSPFVNPPPAANAEPSQNSAGVWHYTCGKGCAGGSGAAGNCVTCGGVLSHNIAYHQ